MKINKIRKSLNNKYVRIGGYSTIISLAVIAIVVVVNLIVIRIPAIYTKFDTSNLKMYSISDETIKLIKEIDTNITMYYVTSSEDTTITEFLERYTSFNSKIKLQRIDPVMQPNFVMQHTTEQFMSEDGGVIVVSDKRTKLVDYHEIYASEYYINQQTGNYDIRSTFDGESKITSVLDYVSSSDIPTIYLLSGHGEPAFPDTMRKYISDDNYDLLDLNLFAFGEVPADASCLLIYYPQYDLNFDETEIILEYLANGGKMTVISGYTQTELPNLYRIAAQYGLQLTHGLVIEGSDNNWYYTPYFLLPKLGSGEIINMLPSTNIYVLMGENIGMYTMDTLPRSTLKVTPLLFTTASAYLKTGEFQTLELEEDDLERVFSVASMVTEPSPTGRTTKLIWYTSPMIIDESADMMTSGSNSTLFLTGLTWMTEKKASITVASKPLQVAALMMSEMTANVLSVIFIGVIPLAFLGIGFVVWFKRRKR
ncbi:MAG: GldG family protein [Oscillospiraceae bacterium]|nr:GldG family protein [Oscillospiraceae bacterium]